MLNSSESFRKNPVKMTPAAQALVTCHDCPKPKDYVSDMGLKAHVKRMHQVAVDQVQKLATILSPPAPGAPAPGAPAPAPPTPAVATAPTSTTPATPAAVAGGSGLITPKISGPVPRTLSFSGSSSTEERHGDKEAIEEELDAEPEVLEDAAKEQELFEKLVQMTQEAFNPDLEDEGRQVLKLQMTEVTQKLHTNDKHKSFMLEQLRKDASMLKKKLEKQRQLEMENTTLKHELKLEGEVGAHLRTTVSDKEAELSDVTKRLKKLETEHKKSKEQNKVEIDTVNETVGNVTKINIDLKTEIATMKAHIESLEEEISPDASTETVEVEVHNQEEAATVQMNKQSNEHKCHACDKLFNADKDLNSHIRDKHTESTCHMCDKKFTTTKQAAEHICMEGELVAQVCEKSYCKKEFISSTALKDHMETSHFGNQRSVCLKCGKICGNKGSLKKHMETCSKISNEDKDKQERSKEVCYHWRRGNCMYSWQFMWLQSCGEARHSSS